MSAMWIEARVPVDRRRLGSIIVFDGGDEMFPPIPTATFRAFFKADQARADQEGNPNRDPRRPYGDFPLGNYRIGDVVFGGKYGCEIDLDPWETAKHGPLLATHYGAFQAARAFEKTNLDGSPKVARWGIDIHGGRMADEGYVYPHCLRPTFGCARMRDSDVIWLGDIIQRRLLREPLVLLQAFHFSYSGINGAI